MPEMVLAERRASHVLLSDVAVRMAKVAADDVRFPDTDADKVAVGRAVEAAFRVAWPSTKVAAGQLGLDEREIGKWFTGERRPQFDRCLPHPVLWAALVVELARLEPEQLEVVTEIRFRGGPR